jgi:arylsulfatase A-like enzyme
MMSHMDWWPTFARLAGVEPPPHIWTDNKGKPIVFDGIDNSDYLLGRGPSKRDDMFYFYDQSFGAVRVKEYKFLFTAKDTWLGPSQPLTSAPAVYNLLWDPAEQYDILFNGAAPTRAPTNSPGKFGRPRPRLDYRRVSDTSPLSLLRGDGEVPEHPLEGEGRAVLLKTGPSSAANVPFTARPL